MFRVEYPKLHLHPRPLEHWELRRKFLPQTGLSYPLTFHPCQGGRKSEAPEISPNVVCKDFLEYLLNYTRNHLRDITKTDLWSRFGDEADLVMTYPNDWPIRARQLLVRSAIQAKWISQARSRTNLHLVPEAEAAARYFIRGPPRVSPAEATHVPVRTNCYPKAER